MTATAAPITVALFGELDMSGFDALVTVLREAAEHPGITGVCVDLGGVGFVDSKGMQALIIGYRAAQRAGVHFAVTRPQKPVRSVLRMAGLLDFLSGNEPVPPAPEQAAG